MVFAPGVTEQDLSEGTGRGGAGETDWLQGFSCTKTTNVSRAWIAPVFPSRQCF